MVWVDSSLAKITDHYGFIKVVYKNILGFDITVHQFALFVDLLKSVKQLEHDPIYVLKRQGSCVSRKMLLQIAF
jgi:hypothetical protein